jgi:hypothetical protein
MVSKKLSIVPKYDAYDAASTILRLYGPEHEKAKTDYNKIISTVNTTDNLDLLVEVNYGLEVLLKNPKFPHGSMIKIRKRMNKEEIEAQHLRLYAIVNMTHSLMENPNLEELVTYAQKNNFKLHDVEMLAVKNEFKLLDQTLKWKAHLDKIYAKVIYKAQVKDDTSSEKHEIKYAGLLRKANEIAEHFQIGRPWSEDYTNFISSLYNKKTVEELTAPIKGEAIPDYKS